ncbi:hypothetical protein CTI12_AA553640 [Artemisia annua]|uniref:Uncharacterized protein n=1 Tax=Artemisia annua TaxID=35608 RepID=A0A2U1KXE8_ARTAN|nr:hypothetical protein CTI12_AA553640 [Artemisia annua]
MEYDINDLRIRRIGKPPSKNNGKHDNRTTYGNNTIDLSIRCIGRPPNKTKGKQPTYNGDIQSDIHSSKRKSDRLKGKIRMTRQKIYDQGFLGRNGATNIIRIMEIQFTNVKPVTHYSGMRRVLWEARIQILVHSRSVVADESGDPTTTSGTSALDHQLTVDLRDMLDSINPLVAQFCMAGEQFVASNKQNKFKIRLIGTRERDGREYNLPIADEVAALIDHVGTIIQQIYPNLKDNLYKSGYFQERAILAPTHELVDMINDRILDLISSDEHTYDSSDTELLIRTQISMRSYT